MTHEVGHGTAPHPSSMQHRSIVIVHSLQLCQLMGVIKTMDGGGGDGA